MRGTDCNWDLKTRQVQCPGCSYSAFGTWAVTFLWKHELMTLADRPENTLPCLTS